MIQDGLNPPIDSRLQASILGLEVDKIHGSIVA
jgi:hypothetical protein